MSSLVAGGVQREGAGSRGEDRLAKADSLFLGSPLCLIEVFSPRIRTLLKGVVEAAGQGCGQPSAKSIEVPRLGLRQGALATSLA